MMKNSSIVLLIALLLLSASCSKQIGNSGKARVPKVAFLTTGAGTGNGEIPSGVLIAQRFFNSKGILFFVETRDILFDQGKLHKYDMLIVSTAAGYHDADRGYSLSFMTDGELNNLAKWVREGGFLIAGDNIGRNYIDGKDRITSFRTLKPENWALSEVLGVELAEKNMRGYSIEGDSGFFGGLTMRSSGRDEWVLVPTLLQDFNGKVKAWWINDTLKAPAIVWNQFGRGQSILLSSSYLLHPANYGGFRSVSQIEGFYDEIIKALPGCCSNMRLNLWPGVYTQAFALTLKPQGDPRTFDNAKEFAKTYSVPLTVFHTPQFPADSFTSGFKGALEIASGGASNVDYNELNYPKSLQEIIQNNIQEPYRGFRFPFYRQSYWGLMALENLSYKYESSIRVDQQNEIAGCLHPYHMPISSRGYYTITNLVEISPMLNDDYHFYGDVPENNPLTMEKRSLLFDAYLQRFQTDLVSPYHGVMVYAGHPAYTFQDDTTKLPLTRLVQGMQSKGDTWFTTLGMIADRWYALEQMDIQIEQNSRRTILECHAPEEVVVEDLSFELDKKPKSASASRGRAFIRDRDGKYYVIFLGCDNQVVKIVW